MAKNKKQKKPTLWQRIKRTAKKIWAVVLILLQLIAGVIQNYDNLKSIFTDLHILG